MLNDIMEEFTFGANFSRLYQGDCLQIMQTLEADSVDLVLTDPPYGTTACKWDTVIPFEPLWEQLKRIRQSNAAIVLTATQPFTSMLIASNLKEFRYCWVWDKQVGRGHLVAKKRPMARHEDVCVFYGKPPTYAPQMTKREKPIRGKEGKRTLIMGGESSGYEAVYEYKYPQTIISIPSEGNANKLHPTQKPIALMEYLIKTYTKEGDTVLDFTMGSGTTGVACKRLGRHFVGVELDKNYFRVAKERIMATPAREASNVE
jgi:site-specific DNA-methyltransferase (adenine-specific)